MVLVGKFGKVREMPLPKPVLRVAASGHLSRSVFYQRQQLIKSLLDADLDDGRTLAALHVALVAYGQVRAAQGTGLGELAGPGSIVYCPSPAPASSARAQRPRV